METKFGADDSSLTVKNYLEAAPGHRAASRWGRGHLFQINPCDRPPDLATPYSKPCYIPPSLRSNTNKGMSTHLFAFIGNCC